jgi:predicted metal-dependent phosphoesterase TrpH
VNGSGRPVFVDLHTHSIASDGSLPPEEVVRKAKQAGLAAIALTDHDTINGVAAAQAEGARIGVRVVPGTELSAYHGELEVHVLALHLDRMDVIADKLTEFQNARHARAEEMVRLLQDAGISITMQDILKQAAGGAIGRPHIARALVEAGAVTDQQEAFEKYLAANRPAYVSKLKIGVEEAIEIAHQAGGIAVWAHPCGDGTRDRVKLMKDMGLDGIEVRHPGHTPQDIERLSAMAGEFDMLRSGGSDWHGARTGRRVLGVMQIPFAWLEEQDARVAA